MMGVMIFVGLIVFWIASEILSRSPAAVRGRPAFVRDSIFPVDVLPWVCIGVAVFNAMVRAALFLVVILLLAGSLPLTAFLFPLVIAPMVLIFIGVAFAFSAIGAYVRDLDFVLSALMTGLLLLSAVLYPISEVPEHYQAYVRLNPIAMAVEQTRLVVVLGRAPEWAYLGWTALVGVAMCWGGFILFRLIRGRFADVV